MAKRKGRKFRKYLRGEIEKEMALGTLAAKTLLSDTVNDSVTESAWLSSVKGVWSIEDMTPGANVGPILCGVAHSDYSDAEIEAWIENTSSWEVGDLVATREIGRRLIKKVGVFENKSAAGVPAVLNDGRPVTTKCGWQLSTGQTVRLWAYNKGSAALSTTDPVLSLSGHANLWPN